MCERVDYNLIIGFSLSFSGDADAAAAAAVVTLKRYSQEFTFF